MILDCAGKQLDLSQPRVMGVLNITPDSFSDGGQFLASERAIAQAQEMVAQGAAIIDVGGESTRPGADEVPLEEEIRRVVPVIEALAPALSVPISVDTSKPEVMLAAVEAGAGMINDVYALRRSGAMEMAASLNVPICLMHMQGEPRSMQQQPRYDDVVADVIEFLRERVNYCLEAGIRREALVLDPGFGFGKSLEHNLSLLKHLDILVKEGLPVLAGMSRKSMIGAVLDAPVDKRLFGSIAVATLAAWQGAKLIRVHDVKATVDALAMASAVVDAL